MQPLIGIKSRKKEKNEKREKKGTRIDHMTERKRRQNLVKCCSVSLQTGMNQRNCPEVNELAQAGFEKKIVVIIVQNGLKL